MKKYMMTGLSLLVFLTFPAQAVKMAKPLGNIFATYGECLNSNNGNDVYLSGIFSGTLSFGQDIELSAGQPTVFTAKLTGNTIDWAKITGDTQQNDTLLSATTDASGQLYLLTATDEKYRITRLSDKGLSTSLTLSGTEQVQLHHIFIANKTLYCSGIKSGRLFAGAYTLDGVELWQTILDDYPSAKAVRILADETGLIFLAGEYTQTSHSDLFIIRLDRDGRTTDKSLIEGSGRECLSDMILLPSGILILAGSTQSETLNIDNQTITTTSTGTEHILCLAFNTEVSFLWHYTGGSASGSNHARATTLREVGTEQFFMGGLCNGKLIFNPDGNNRYNLPDKGGDDFFLMKLDKTGTILDVKRMGGNTDECIKDILFTANDTELFLLSDFKGRTQYGTFHTTTNIDMTGQKPYLITAEGKESNTVLSKYNYIRLYGENLTEAQIQIPYSGCIYHQGGSKRVNYELESGTLPDGLQFSAAGDISGTPLQTGIYPLTIKGTDELGNTAALTVHLVVKDASVLTGTENDNTSPMQIYPNPASSQIRLGNRSLPTPAQITITDTQGVIRLTGTVWNQDTDHIDVSGLSPGMYFVRCTSAGHNKVAKLIKE